MKIGLVDNFDSFTYNLVHTLESFEGVQVDVFRNNALQGISPGDFDAWVLSPGPGLPDQAGELMLFIAELIVTRPVLGVCLGHQALIRAAGGHLCPVVELRHGVSRRCKVLDKNDALYRGLPAEIDTARYHSWVVSHDGFPVDYLITGIDELNQIMSVRHRQLPVWGIQFHPESVLTPQGRELLGNWLTEVYLCRESKPPCRS